MGTLLRSQQGGRGRFSVRGGSQISHCKSGTSLLGACLVGNCPKETAALLVILKDWFTWGRDVTGKRKRDTTEKNIIILRNVRRL